MKLNKTNCKLDICIKRRRVYFKNRVKYRKNRLLSLLLLIKTTFYIIFNTVNYKNISSFFKLSFCKKFFRVKWKFITHNAHILTQKCHTPNYSNVNTHRGSRRRSSSAPKSTLKCNEPDFSNVNTHRGSHRRSPNISESTQNCKAPDYSNVNTRRGTRRRAPQVTDSNNDSNMLDLRFVNCKRGTSRFSPSTSKPLEATEIPSHVLEPDLYKVTVKRGSRASDKNCHGCVVCQTTSLSQKSEALGLIIELDKLVMNR